MAYINIVPSRWGFNFLVGVSLSRFANLVKTVGFGPPCFDQGNVIFTDRAENLSQTEKDQIANEMVAFANDNRRMRTLGEDATMIRTALRNLPNVINLQIIEKKYGFHSFGLWEINKISRKGAARFEEDYFDGSQCLSRILSVAMDAAANLNLRIERIHTHFFLEEYRDYRLNKEGSGEKNSLVEFPRVTGSFATLSVLRFAIGPSNELSDEVRRRHFVSSLASFLSNLPALQTLAIGFAWVPWSPEIAKDLSTTVARRSLNTLELHSLYVEDSFSTMLIEALSGIGRSLKELNFLKPLFETETPLFELLDCIPESLPELRKFKIYDARLANDVESDPEVDVEATSRSEFRERLEEGVRQLREDMGQR